MNSFNSFAYELKHSFLGENIKSMFTLPTIGLPSTLNVGSTEFLNKFTAIQNILEVLGLSRGIPILASSQQEVGENSIGQQILVRSKELGTQPITDNVAPMPRIWLIKGYIGVKQGENVGMNVAFGNNVLTLTLVQAIKDYFRYLRLLRAPFKFITKEGETIDVLMQMYNFEDEPISEYATKIELRLTEFVALSINETSYSLLNAPGLGSMYGTAAKYANVASRSIGSDLRLLIGVL